VRVGAPTARAAVALGALLAIAAASRPALARARLAVLILVDSDPALADNLTEVAISALAERRDRELVGTRELRRRLSSLLPVGEQAACLARPACLAEVGAAAGAEQAVIGSVRRQPDGFQLDLALTDTRTAVRAARVSRAVPPELPALIAAVREGAAALFERAPAGAVATELPPPAPTPAAVDLTRRDERAPSPAPRRASIAAYLGVGAVALAAVAYSAAAVRGGIATATPVGASRADTQADLERREVYAREANDLLIVGGALSAAGGAAFVWWWRSSER
jgi:hypothetical protein